MGENYTSQSRSEFDWYNPHLNNYLHPLLFYNTFGFFSTSFERTSAGKLFTSILRSHKCEIIYTRFHAFMLSSTMALCGEKTGESNTFLYFLWYSDKSKDYTSQTRSDFDWYNPHLYNYLHPLLFYKHFFL